MLFTSPNFWIFYIVVIISIQLNNKIIKSIQLQNVILLVASYCFYACWDWRFLGLIILVSVQTYLFGALISRSNVHQKKYLLASVLINIGVLGYFKYFNFFSRELIQLFQLESSYTLSNIILPVGISFYIFQSLTYVVDIYYKKILPERNIITYLTYISFFPQLVAGPIERASRLIPQFKTLKAIDSSHFYAGLKIIILGLFLKVFIADNLAPHVDLIFQDYKSLDGGTLFLGGIYFAIQIYGDFCGYSLIAIGVAKIMGFELMRNFDTPYFSTNIQDFWRRWHISLSSFFRDYVYIPLGGSRGSTFIQGRNLLGTFLLSGIWHGANWTFMAWGLMHGSLLVLQKIVNISMPKVLGWVLTMGLVLLLWIVFRSETLVGSVHYVLKIVFHMGIPQEHSLMPLIFVVYYLLVDFLLFKFKEKELTFFNNLLVEIIILAFMLMLVVGTMHEKSPNFIYFQF